MIAEANWKTPDKERHAELLQFVRQFTADRLRVSESLATSIRTANKAAGQLEEGGKTARAKAWRAHVQGRVLGCGKGAYAYAKGPIGCIDAPEPLNEDSTTG